MYKTIEEFIGNTPLVRLQRMPQALGIAGSNVVLAKLEGDNPVADCPATLVLRWGAGRRTRFGRSEDRPA